MSTLFLRAGATRSVFCEGRSSPKSSIWVRISQIDARNGMSGKEYLPETIVSRWSQRYQVAAESLANPEDSVAKPDPTVPLNLAHHVAPSIFQRRQGLGKMPSADLVTTGGHRHGQRLVRPQMVIDRAPLVQALLQGSQIGKGRPIEDLGFQRAMETLLFALGLRMVRPAVTNPNAQPQQPDRQRSVGMLAITAPGRAVIQQHPLRQSITAKGFGQPLLNRVPPLIAAPLQTDGIAGMIVQHRQRVTAGAIAQGKMPFEIHLPQLIGGLMLETLPPLMFGRLGRVDPPMTAQNSMNGTGRWQPCLTQGLQPRPNLRAPQAGCASRTDSICCSVCRRDRRGERRGRRDRSLKVS